MRNRNSLRPLELAPRLVLFAVALAVAPQALTRESVRAELIRLQHEKGLTLAWPTDDRGVQAVLFEERRVVFIKDSSQSFGPDGFLNLRWNSTHGIAPWIDERSRFTHQCWSPDHKQVAYGSDGSVLAVPIDADTPPRVLAKGTDVTWSPDGNWISFRENDTYYAIHPDGNGMKKLFHKGGAVSALYWSPDSRIVAYVRELGFLQGGALDAEVNELRVRRLEDGSEDALSRGGDWYADYRWISSKELMELPRPASPH
jgi:hypothetical protein